jgi:hypothetical protein
MNAVSPVSISIPLSIHGWAVFLCQWQLGLLWTSKSNCCARGLACLNMLISGGCGALAGGGTGRKNNKKVKNL